MPRKSAVQLPAEMPKELDINRTLYQCLSGGSESTDGTLRAEVLGETYTIGAPSLTGCTVSMVKSTLESEREYTWGDGRTKKGKLKAREYLTAERINSCGFGKWDQVGPTAKTVTHDQVIKHLTNPLKKEGVTIDCDPATGYRLATIGDRFCLVRPREGDTDHRATVIEANASGHCEVKVVRALPRKIPVDTIHLSEKGDNWCWHIPLSEIWAAMQRQWTWLADPYAWKKRFGDAEMKYINLKVYPNKNTKGGVS